MMGMFASTPALREEGETRSRYGADRSQFLGSLYDRERDRDNPYTRQAAVAAYGGLPRDIEAQQEQAKYNALMAELLFPYQQQAGLAQVLLGYQPWHQPQFYEEESMFSQLAPLAGTAVGAIAGGPIGAAIGSKIGGAVGGGAAAAA